MLRLIIGVSSYDRRECELVNSVLDSEYLGERRWKYK